MSSKDGNDGRLRVLFEFFEGSAGGVLVLDSEVKDLGTLGAPKPWAKVHCQIQVRENPAAMEAGSKSFAAVYVKQQPPEVSWQYDTVWLVTLFCINSAAGTFQISSSSSPRSYRECLEDDDFLQPPLLSASQTVTWAIGAASSGDTEGAAAAGGATVIQSGRLVVQGDVLELQHREADGLRDCQLEAVQTRLVVWEGSEWLVRKHAACSEGSPVPRLWTEVHCSPFTV